MVNRRKLLKKSSYHVTCRDESVNLQHMKKGGKIQLLAIIVSGVCVCGQVTHAAHIKNEAEKERNKAARQMDTLMKVGSD